MNQDNAKQNISCTKWLVGFIDTFSTNVMLWSFQINDAPKINRFVWMLLLALKYPFSN